MHLVDALPHHANAQVYALGFFLDWRRDDIAEGHLGHELPTFRKVEWRTHRIVDAGIVMLDVRAQPEVGARNPRFVPTGGRDCDLRASGCVT